MQRAPSLTTNWLLNPKVLVWLRHTRADNLQETQVNHVWPGLDKAGEKVEDGKPGSIKGSVAPLGRPPKTLSTGPKAVREVV